MQCPSCGTTDPLVYFGFSKIECPNPRCLHHVSERPGGVALLEGTPAPATVPAPATLPAPPPHAWCPQVGDPVRLDQTAGPPYSDRPVIVRRLLKQVMGVELITSLSSGQSIYLNVSLDRVIPWEPRVGERVRLRTGGLYNAVGVALSGTVIVELSVGFYGVAHDDGAQWNWTTTRLLPEV